MSAFLRVLILSATNTQGAAAAPAPETPYTRGRERLPPRLQRRGRECFRPMTDGPSAGPRMGPRVFGAQDELPQDILWNGRVAV